jgi:hypothetical protein
MKKYAISAVACAFFLLAVHLYIPTAHCYAYPPLQTIMRITFNETAQEWSREFCLLDEQMSTVGGRMEAYRSLYQ